MAKRIANTGTKIIMALVVAFSFLGGMKIGIRLNQNAQPESTPMTKSDEYIRDRVVKIFSEQGSCSGIQVRAPSGRVYIMSAGHCKVLLHKDGTVLAQTENNSIYVVKYVDSNIDTDLLLLTSVDNKFVDVAGGVYLHQHIKTLTHGGGAPTYRTDGELLEEKDNNVLYGVVETDEEKKACEKSPLQHVESSFFGDACIRTMRSMMTTAKVIPGSSGGGAFDDNGNLVGICSNTDGMMFGGLVPLREIQNFLKNR